MDTKRPVLTVRLTTLSWHNDKGMHLKKSITFLKRRSYGCNHVLGDCISVGAEEIFRRIVNINNVADGVYRLKLYNVETDEYGNMDGWEYKLIPDRS